MRQERVENITGLAIPNFHWLGLCDYQDMHVKMQAFTDSRTIESIDEVWFVEHPSVFTLGRNGSKQNILVESEIPVVQSNRGGDVTYHGPGQLVVYCLLDLNRLRLGVKSLVWGLEEVFIQYLSNYDVIGQRIEKAPGVYVEGRKVASLGLRVRKGCSFHGMAINVDMDLNPFSKINPCGLQGMKVAQLSDLGIQRNCDQVASELSEFILQQFYQ